MRLPWRYGAVSLPLCAAAAWFKLRDLENVGFHSAARGLGRLDEFTLIERLSFFRWDLVVALVVLPAILVLAARAVRPAWRVAVVLALVSVVSVAVFTQVQAMSTTGGLLHARMIWSAVGFARERPDMIASYVPLRLLVKLGAVLLASALLAIFAARHDRDRGAPEPAAIMRVAGLVAGVAAGALLLQAWRPRLPATPMHRPLIPRAIAGYWAPHGSALAARMTPADAIAGYRALTNAPPASASPPRFGLAAGHDVLIYVMETVPTKCLDFTGNLGDLPTITRLRRRALVAARHYTAYPYSSLSNFSTLSGWYPPPYSRAYANRHRGGRVRGLLWPLRERGYHTAIYEPYYARFEDDPTMYDLLGVERYVVPGGNIENLPPREVIARKDSTAIALLRADMAGWLSAGERYAVVVMPQISHGPWPGPESMPLYARCRRLVAIQDGWIGGLVSEIEAHGRLDRTLIVVLADHGIRTAAEDPDFVPGRMDERSFHVPFLLYAPAAFRATETIPYLTSSIDVTPSLLDLLGIERERATEQGAPLWDRRIAGRTTFFFAQEMFGADGFYHAGRFAALNSVNGIACRSDMIMRCTDRDIVARGAGRDSIVDLLAHMNDIRYAWLERFVEAAK